MRSPTVPQVSQGCGLKSGRPKLDSCFIEDVSVLDGSIMAPSAPFIKIWRMRNNGNIVWPKGTKLVWIGGDRLCDACSVELQVRIYTQVFAFCDSPLLTIHILVLLTVY